MALTFIVFAGFYEPARHAIAYADMLAQAAGGKLVLLHINRAAAFDPYELAGPAGERYHREELVRQTNTAEALRQLAQELRSVATVEVATDLVPELTADLAARHHPALFVLGQPDPAHPDFAGLAAACAELLRIGNHPLLAVPPTAGERPPHRFLLAADEEPFKLTAASQVIRALFAQLATSVVVAHVSSGVADDEGCSAALRAVENSDLFELVTPELRGYEHSNYGKGIITAIADTQADWVVLLARQRSYLSELFHRSVTARVLDHSPVPVLLLPATAETPHPATAQRAHFAAQ